MYNGCTTTSVFRLPLTTPSTMNLTKVFANWSFKESRLPVGVATCAPWLSTASLSPQPWTLTSLTHLQKNKSVFYFVLLCFFCFLSFFCFFSMLHICFFLHFNQLFICFFYYTLAFYFFCMLFILLFVIISVLLISHSFT